MWMTQWMSEKVNSKYSIHPLPSVCQYQDYPTDGAGAHTQGNMHGKHLAVTMFKERIWIWCSLFPSNTFIRKDVNLVLVCVESKESVSCMCSCPTYIRKDVSTITTVAGCWEYSLAFYYCHIQPFCCPQTNNIFQLCPYPAMLAYTS